MTIQETITLLNAGYTKADIDAMSAAPAPQQTTEPASAPAIEKAAAQPMSLTPEALQAFTQMLSAKQTVTAPATQPAPAATASEAPVTTPAAQPLTLSAEQLQQLIQGVAVQTAGGTVETPPSAQSSLEKMYESIVGQVAKKED